MDASGDGPDPSVPEGARASSGEDAAPDGDAVLHDEDVAGADGDVADADGEVADADGDAAGTAEDVADADGVAVPVDRLRSPGGTPATGDRTPAAGDVGYPSLLDAARHDHGDAARETPPAHPEDAFGPGDAEALAAAGNEVRLAAIERLHRAERAGEGPVTFTELFEATDADTTAGFAYHLRQLDGRYVRAVGEEAASGELSDDDTTNGDDEDGDGDETTDGDGDETTDGDGDEATGGDGDEATDADGDDEDGDGDEATDGDGDDEDADGGDEDADGGDEDADGGDDEATDGDDEDADGNEATDGDGATDGRDGDGYRLTAAGRRLARALAAGAFDDGPSVDPAVVGEPCPHCGAAALATAAGDGAVAVACAACERPVLTAPAPPGADGAAPARLLRAVDRRQRHRLSAMADGVCPDCGGPVATTLAEPPEPATAGLPGGDRRVRARLSCGSCGTAVRAPVTLGVLDHPAAVAFYREHGVDLRERPVRNVGEEWRETVLSTDPWCVRVSTALGGDVLSLLVDGDLEVRAVRRPSAS